MIKLTRLHFPEDSPQRSHVRQIAVVQKQILVVNLRVATQMLDPRPEQITRPPHNPMNRVPLLQEQFG
jgi:hypothetical protein